MADTPFGLSFGNPRQYMGQSGLKEVADKYKQFATVKAIDKSGLRGFLNEALGNPDEGYKPPEGYAPSGGVMPPANYGMSAPQGSAAPGEGNAGLGFKGTTSQMGISPAAPVGLSPYRGPQAATDMGYTSTAPVANPPAQSNSYLGDAMSAFKVSSYVDPSASHDIPVEQGGGYTEQLAENDAYTKVPGYGKLQKVLSQMFGAMG